MKHKPAANPAPAPAAGDGAVAALDEDDDSALDLLQKLQLDEAGGSK